MLKLLRRTVGRHPGLSVLAFFLVGLFISTAVPGNLYRGWFALMAFLLMLAFVLLYSRRNWRSTFAGRASMLSVSVGVIYSANVVAILWFPHDGGYGYPHWEDVTEVIYLLMATGAAYKLMALLLAEKPCSDVPSDPTTEYKD